MEACQKAFTGYPFFTFSNSAVARVQVLVPPLSLILGARQLKVTTSEKTPDEKLPSRSKNSFHVGGTVRYNAATRAAVVAAAAAATALVCLAVLNRRQTCPLSMPMHERQRTE